MRRLLAKIFGWERTMRFRAVLVDLRHRKPRLSIHSRFNAELVLPLGWVVYVAPQHPHALKAERTPAMMLNMDEAGKGAHKGPVIDVRVECMRAASAPALPR